LRSADADDVAAGAARFEGISILIPAYNEASFIEVGLAEAAQAMAASGRDFEIIVADDGSSDETFALATAAKSALPVALTVVRSSKNRGKGNALRRAFRQSRGALVAFLDADLELHPAQIPRLASLLEEQRAAAVVGSKHHPTSRVDAPPLRKFLSALYLRLTRLLFGLPVRDTQSGLKLFRADALERVLPDLTIDRYAFDVELLLALHQAGYPIVEAPVEVTVRRPRRRIGLRDGARLLIDTLALRYRTLNRSRRRSRSRAMCAASSASSGNRRE
jgi:glycosyltransferase involved in cell wall biosynthesis